MLTSLKRIFKMGWLSFSRDGGLMVANIFIIAMVISVITSLFLLKDISQFITSNLQEKVDISVYFKYETPEEEILQAKEEIGKISEVKEIQYISKETALEKFTERHKDNPILMESLEEVGVNPFLATLNIKSFRASQYEAINQFLNNANFENLIEKVDYYERKPAIERIFSLTSNLNMFGIIFSIILVMVAVLVAFNTVRLAIYNVKEEIKIQRLVGASNWFIRGPFLAQGAIAGFLATLGCLSLFTLLTFVFNSKIAILFPDLSLFSLFISNFWLIALIQLATGIGLGVISSLIAIRRYLEA